MMRTDIRQRVDAAPGLRPAIFEVGKRIASMASAEEVLKQGANLLTEQRGNPMMFVRFSQPDLNIVVESSSGILRQGHQDFACETPTTGLIAKALIERVSVHIPDISGLFIEAIDDKDVSREEHFEREIKSALPLEFGKSDGSALLTPLGLEKSTAIGFGFIFEYNESRPFSLESMIEARAYASLFTLHIAGKFLKEFEKSLKRST